MKKSLVLVLALVFVLSLSSAAFAAANPFVDVPAKHWAYDAVSQLAKAGIVDGYGDGTFRGDKTMTRYEMAQIVAKAMAKSDKADAATKATIDKLAVEFAAELNNLGVRVGTLEKNASSVKISGDARIRFQQNYSVNAAGTGNDANGIDPSKLQKDAQKTNERVRLYVESTASDAVKFQGRFSFQNQNRENITDATNTLQIEYARFLFNNFAFGNTFSIGRDQINLGYGLVAAPSGFYDAAKVYFGGKEVKGWVGYGDISDALGTVATNPGSTATATYAPKTNTATVALTNDSSAVNITSFNTTWDANKDLQLALSGYYSNTRNYNYRVTSLGAKYKVIPTLTLYAEYAHNSAKGDHGLVDATATVHAAGDPASALIPYATAAGVYNGDKNQQNAWFAQLAYKGADVKKVGSFGIYVNYKKYGANAVDPNLTSIPIFENVADNFLLANGNKGFGYAFDYTVMKNARFVLSYEDLKSYDGAIKHPGFTYGHFEFVF